MRNVFVAIGGSGAKAAEALVRLLAMGFPTHRDKDGLTSAGDSLQIWRVDPDRSSGAATSLQNTVKAYADLQRHLNDMGDRPATSGIGSSSWAIDIDANVRFLDPLALPGAAATDNQVKTLRGILNSGYAGSLQSSLPLLAPFYAQKDLDVMIDRGFYQKPFIGAPVMAAFANSLQDDNSPAGREAGLTAFHNNQTNFFLCGSLHGGTGACGVPIMGKYLSRRKKDNPAWNWRVGACLLAPYCVPPQPPFSALREGDTFTDQQVNELVRMYTEHPSFLNLTLEQKKELVKQILLGFFADPEDMEKRARQGLAYYADHSKEYFDELYLVGKPEPDKLTTWSNGGQSQSNPLNSAEVVAAISALNFFSFSNTGDKDSYVMASSTAALDSRNMRLGQLPRYTLSDGTEIDPEKVFLATAAMRFLVTHSLPWESNRAKEWTDVALKRIYTDNEPRKVNDRNHFLKAAELFSGLIASTVSNDPKYAIGWAGGDARVLHPYLADDQASVSFIAEKVSKRFMNSSPKEPLELGETEISVTTFDFAKWCPKGNDFTRGDYLRNVWNELYKRAKDRRLD